MLLEFIEKYKVPLILLAIIGLALFSSGGTFSLFQWYPYSYHFNYVNVLDDRIDVSWWAEGYGYIDLEGLNNTFHTIIMPNNDRDHPIIDTKDMDLLKNYDFEGYKPCKYSGNVKLKCYYDTNDKRICLSEWKYYSISGEGLDYCKVKVSPKKGLCVRGTGCSKLRYRLEGDAYITLNPKSITEIPIKNFDYNKGVKLGSFTITWSIPKKVETVEFVVIVSEMYTDKKIQGAICSIDGITKTTNENGEAKFVLKPGNYRLDCSVPNHEPISQDITVTSAGGWIGVSTPKKEKTCEDFGYFSSPPDCKTGTPETISVNGLTCYTGRCITVEKINIYYIIGGIIVFLIIVLSIIYYKL